MPASQFPRPPIEQLDRAPAMGTKPDYRSRIVTQGLDRTPHRAFLRASGRDDNDLDKPQIGIVSTHGENTPCSMSLAPQADAARLGVAAGGGGPGPFPATPGAA